MRTAGSPLRRSPRRDASARSGFPSHPTGTGRVLTESDEGEGSVFNEEDVDKREIAKQSQSEEPTHTHTHSHGLTFMCNACFGPNLMPVVFVYADPSPNVQRRLWRATSRKLA